MPSLRLLVRPYIFTSYILMNGTKSRKQTTAQMIAKTKARQSPPEPIKPDNPIGVGHAFEQSVVNKA